MSAEVRSRARAATGELLTAVVTLAGLPAADARQVLAQAAPYGKAVTVEQLAVVLHRCGFGLQLVATPYPPEDALYRNTGAPSVGEGR